MEFQKSTVSLTESSVTFISVKSDNRNLLRRIRFTDISIRRKP